MRIVSLLPSTTEILFDIGAGDDIVGVTFECDHPAEARERTIVSTSALPEGLDAAGIDAFVAAAMRAGEDLYRLDEGALSGLDADLVVTQDLCAVCAVDVSVVDDALAHLGCSAEVLTIDPHTLEEVLDSVLALGAATGHEAQATRLVGSLRERLDRVAKDRAAKNLAAKDLAAKDLAAKDLAGRVDNQPRVLLLEWTDPPFAPGHWVPEMITTAGGVPTLGAAGQASERVTWEQARESEPELVVVAPCGYDLDGSSALGLDLVRSGVLPPGLPVWAVDANASFARPGPRLVDGVESLARIIAGEAPAESLARRLR